MKTNNYLLTESLVGSLATYMILKKLMTDFSEWDAHKLGIIDKNGKKLKHPVTSKEREAWDILTRFCWNIKKISTKFIGKSKFAQYFTAAYLLKDSINVFYVEKNKHILNETLLSDITYAKQNCIFNILKQLPEVKCTTDEELEVMIYKYVGIVEKVLNTSDIYNLFEDSIGIAGGAVPPADGNTFATTTANLAPAPGQYLGVAKKNAINPNKIVKKDLKKYFKLKKRKKDKKS